MNYDYSDTDGDGDIMSTGLNLQQILQLANIWRLLHFEIVIVNKQYLRSFTPKKLVPSDQPDQSIRFPYRYPQTIVDSFTPKKSNIWSTCLINPGSIVKLP